MKAIGILGMVVTLAGGLSATQYTYSDSGGAVTQTSILTITGAAWANPAGTISMSCPLTETTPQYPYYSEWTCVGGSLSAQSRDGKTKIQGSFTSGVFTLDRSSLSGGTFTYALFANFAGSQSINGKSTAVIGAVTETLAPLSGYLGTGTIQSGLIDVSQQHEPIYIADTGNNRVVVSADALGSNWTSLGKAGSGAKQFSQPWGIALDSAGKIYVSDSGNCRVVRVDNISGANWTSFGGCGSGAGEFSNPQGLWVDANGKIYVADTGNNRIVRMDDMSGTNFLALGTLGNGANQFHSPAAVTTDAAGNIYVADNVNARVAEFADMTGANWAVLQFPVGYLTPDGVAVDATNRIYVTDSLQSQVVRTDNITGADEVFLNANGATSIGMFRNPSGIFVDPDDAIYLADTGDNRVLRFFDMSYSYEEELGTLGSGVHNLNQPHGIAVMPVTKSVAVAAVNPPSLAFPTQVVGSEGPAESAVLTNIGSKAFEITSVTSSLADFAQTNNCPTSLAGGQSCTATIDFQPSSGGVRKGSVAFTLAGAPSKSVTLSGSGALVALSMKVLIMFEGQPGMVTVSNPLQTPTTLKSIKVAGSAFSQTNNCGTIAPGGSCQITVHFLYTGLPVTGTLTVTDSSGTPQYVSLTGE